MAGENGDSQVIDGVNQLSVSEGGAAGEAVPSVAERSLLQKVIRKGLIENKNDLEIKWTPFITIHSFDFTLDTEKSRVLAPGLEAHVGFFRLLTYEGDFRSLCSVTFWQKVDFLNSNTC